MTYLDNTIYVIVVIIILFFLYKLQSYFSDLSNNEFIIYFTREEYMPLYLFIKIFENVLIKHNYNVKKIKTFDSNIINSNVNFIAFGLELDDNIINHLVDNKITTIMINTEYYTLWNIMDKINKLYDKTKLYVLDYNPVNIIEITKIHPKINIIYLPLLYNRYLIDFYNSNITKKIKVEDKDIDILVFGSVNERRSKVLDELSPKYNVVKLYTIAMEYSELCNYIERSKIILNMYQFDFNKAFDYYRMAFLISNKIFTIHEYPSDVKLDIETNLVDYDKYLILSTYENFVETTEKYLNNWNPIEINNILNKQYKWFSKYDMEDYVMKFITKLE